MLNKLKNLFKKPVTPEPVVVVVKPKKPRTPRVKKEKVVAPAPIELTEKEKATLAGEPYVNILSLDVDPNNINNGAVELDWNEKFILNLIRAGYKMRDDDTDDMLVDRWWTAICRNTAMEVYQQEQADPDNRNVRPAMNQRDLGNNRTEVS